MTTEIAMQLGRAIAYISRRGAHRHRIVMGKDTRVSCYMLEQALSAGVCSMGVDVLLSGPIPTPAVAFLARTMRADAGVMISASHNPFQDNGIKFFGHDGFKLDDAIEAEIEELLAESRIDDIRPTATAVGKVYRLDDARGRYVQFVKDVFDPKLSLEGMKLVVDCAHGASYIVAPQIFRELGAEVVAVGVGPDGKNINEQCGAVHPEGLQATVKLHGAHAGIALDGDADRLIVVDEKGEVVDGDAVMAICGRDMVKAGQLSENTVVTTVMSNMGLDKCLAEVGAKTVRTQVGDRYVVEHMRAHGYNFGGEQSGHLVFLDQSSTGDGCVAALRLLEVAAREEKPLSELSKVFERVPQRLVNIAVKKKVPLEELPKTSRLIREIEAKLQGTGRVLVRYSGTENKARVMVEGENADDTQRYAQDIAEVLGLELGGES
jgi:phosphoglucosamine mutase